MIILAAPIPPPALNAIDLANVILDVRQGLVIFAYDQTDASGAVTQGRTTMTGPAFVAAFQAASGTFKARLYAVLQGAVPAFAGPVT